ncbi:hypothetical protein BGZ83_006714 [Gryganskiella cystojenkinii]|nr:hypothetical protein BGZ83_006714 [Gryganskiella cystojenkinii]
MYPVHQHPVPIKPHPGPQQPQQIHPLRPTATQPSGQLSQQQTIMQRYQQQRQLQQKQLQLRQLQPLECSNCMALDSLTWKPKVDSSAASPISGNELPEPESKLLCPACTQYLQAHGKSRPVPPFRANFLKKIHTRFKRELQEVRFQGWQDAQVLEIEDRMDEREFQMVFNGLDESDAPLPENRVTEILTVDTSTPKDPTATITAFNKATTPPSTTADSEKTTAPVPSTTAQVPSTTASVKTSSVPEDLVIKIEDDDEVRTPLDSASKQDNVDVRTFQSEASVGELFGHRWRTEPVVGYTLVHFGGSDRTRMVPMNPTVPSLSGGPPALHMPEMADEDESEDDEEEIVVVPDNDKEDAGTPSALVSNPVTPDPPGSTAQDQRGSPDSTQPTQSSSTS